MKEQLFLRGYRNAFVTAIHDRLVDYTNSLATRLILDYTPA